MKNLCRWLYSLFLRWCIWEAESHLRACEDDGLVDSLSLTEFRGQIAADRIRLFLLQPSLQSRAQAKGSCKHWWQSINRRAATVAGPAFVTRNKAAP